MAEGSARGTRKKRAKRSPEQASVEDLVAALEGQGASEAEAEAEAEAEVDGAEVEGAGPGGQLALES